MTDKTKSYLILGLVLVTFVTLVASISINLTTTDAIKKNNTIISQNTIFGFVIMCLGLILYLGTGGSTDSATVVPSKSTGSPTIFSKFVLNTDVSTLIMTSLLVIGIFTSFITTSINLATDDPATQKNIFISQAVIFCVVILGLAFTIHSVIGDDLKSMDIYYMVVLHAAILLSVVSLSATIMSKLAQATKVGKTTIAKN